MPHTYASVAEADNYALSNGASVLASQPVVTVDRKLGALESISRLIDSRMERSSFGSGFGPRTGTNRYDGKGETCLRLRDDLLSVTSVAVRSSTAGSPVAAVETTDYYLRDAEDGYGSAPYRSIVLHGQGSVTRFGSGFRVTDVVGVWGNSTETLTSTTTVASGLAADAAALTFVTSATPTIQIGQTLLIGSEAIYVTGLSGTTATIVRGANGTTGAVHANASAIAVYRYPRTVVDCTLRLYLRRWKARSAGADGTDGGGDVSFTSAVEGEDTIIRRTLYGLRLKEMV